MSSRTTCFAVFSGLSLTLLACGGAEPAPAQTPGNQADAGAALVVPVTDAQLKVAHLATPDGRLGLVIDRSGTTAKMRMDGEKEIVELTMEEDRQSGALRGHYLVDPNNQRRMYLSSRGGYTLYRGRDELALNTTGKAEPLPPATLSGAPKKEKSAYDIATEKLTPLTVRARMPAMTVEDSSRLAKVEQAIKGATADMFVRYVVRDAKEASAPSWKVAPDSVRGTGYGGVGHKSDEKWDKNAKGLKKYGGFVRGFSNWDFPANHMNVVALDGYPERLASGTPGIIWELDGSYATFVTLDGGRYWVSITDAGSGLEAGAGPDDKWPAPVQHALIDITDATQLVKVGEFPKQVEDELFAQDDEWNKCVKKVWAGVQRRIDSNKFNEADRKDTVAKAETTCSAPVKKQEASFLKLVEGRAKARLALFETARARVKELTKK